MYLNKLEIFGFKSFANKSVFTFSPGITAVVGPNGCGKTNVVDAIRWVLGEQKTSILRSEVMENVIFNGTGSRKQLGMAEVSILLENTKGILPVEFSEVTVTRRLFRDGESNYLINNTQCRLKDIVDLFMDTGMGANSYSVIELKMVEAILSGKPEERRHLIEEAAGINKYKQRRKETARKLAYVQNDLVRVNDLVVEVEKNVNSLARQASKTKRYKKLNLEQISLEKQLIAFDFRATNDELNKSSLLFGEMSEEKQKLHQTIADLENYLSTLETQFYKSDEEWTSAVQNENKITAQLAQVNQDFAVSIERTTAAQNNIDRLNKDIATAKGMYVEYDTRLQEIGETEIQARNSISSLNQQLDKFNETRQNAYELVASNRIELNSANENIIFFSNQIKSIDESTEKSEGRRSFLISKIDESRNEIQSLESAKSKLKEEAEQMLEEKMAQSGQLDDLNSKLVEFREIKEQISRKIDDKKHELSDLRVKIAGENSAYEFLSKIVIADDASKYLIENNNWLNGKSKPMLIEMLDTEERFRPAVQAALGEYSNIFIVDSSKDVHDAIALLKTGNKGKAYFIARDSVPNLNLNEHKRDSDVIGYISDIVNTDNEVRNLLRLLIGDVALTENLDSAISYVSGGEGRRAVTLSGEIVDYSGLIKGGSLVGKEGLSVGKYKRIDRISKNLDELNSKLKKEESALENLQRDYLSYNIEQIQSQIKKKETDIYYIESNITQKNYQIENYEQKKNNFLSNIQSFELELSGIGTDYIESEARKAELQSSLDEKKSLIIELNKKLIASESALQNINENVKQIELEITRFNTELVAYGRDRERVENQIKTNQHRIENFLLEISESEKQITELNEKIKSLDTDKQSFSELVTDARTNREILQQKKSELEQQIKSYEEDLSAKRKNFELLTEKVHQIDIAINDLKSRQESVIERNMQLESEQIDPASFEIPEDFNQQNTKTAIQELKNKLTALGMINFMALEDYEKETERLTFYQKQVKDLTDSEKILQDTINEINQTAEQMFRSTFDSVSENFRSLFKKLFSDEGEADLKLSSDNLLECDIEIIAKPPGKKPHSIEMLSGGEKTLTSIAFLFAIYLVKPSPFCILDEVDAPLDDANIDKFIGMIRDFSKNMQFLIVTHNKRTMESADTMYGITQQEEGISRIVSVRFQE